MTRHLARFLDWVTHDSLTIWNGHPLVTVGLHRKKFHSMTSPCHGIYCIHMIKFDFVNTTHWKQGVVMVSTHYSDVMMGAMASQITSLTSAYSTVNSGTDQRKHQSSTSQAFVRGIHRSPVNSPHKRPVTRKMFPFDDVIMYTVIMISSGATKAMNVASWEISVFIAECFAITTVKSLS